MAGAVLHIFAFSCGAASIILLLHASPRRQPFGAARLNVAPPWLRRIAATLMAAMFLIWTLAIGVERALFLSVFFLSLCGGSLLLVHAIFILGAASKRKGHTQTGSTQP